VTDTWTKQKRSEVMAAIRSHGNKGTELRLISIMRAYGIKGWRRRHSLIGKPDFVFPRERLAVFVDGCFWHGCRWHCRMPKSRESFWASKIARNKKRDQDVRRLLHKRGWRVLRFWEHTLQDPSRVAIKIEDVLASAGRQR
jgi:DNA mismatch endonuclease (patch repair protein)